MTNATTADDRPAAPAAVWDGHNLLDAIAIATSWLDANRERVNALNVFPVPDGDTGTNMALTMNAALAEPRDLSSEAQASATAVAAKMAYGALMGARGNSGVILSQVFRGMATGIDGRDEIDGRDLAQALTSAKEMAYKAVMKPVEGTMLTVVRVAAEHAEAASRKSPAMAPVFAAAVKGAKRALAETPQQLDILRQAGVVDAGGQGIVYILEGMHRFATGEQLPDAPEEEGSTLGERMDFLSAVDEQHGEDAYGYCTNFVVFGADIDVEQCRHQLAEMGNSAVIVGDEQTLKVHIHAENPGLILDYAVSLGELGQIKIDNMQQQTRELSHQRTPAVGTESRPPADEPSMDRQAVLAVGAGAGIGEALRSMGASAVVSGGQTMNPSIEELLAAVEALNHDEVIILPNNPNIVLTANQIAELTSKRVGVVPSRSVPQGIAALAAYNGAGALAENVEAMQQALRHVRTVELTKAVRDAEIDGVTVREGQVIGLLDGKLVASGDDLLRVGDQVLQEADVASHELVTIFSGEETPERDVERLADSVRERYADLTVEVHEGGQPHYDFVIAIE